MRQLLCIFIGAVGAAITMSLLFAAWRGESVLGFLAAAVTGLLTVWLYDRVDSADAPRLPLDAEDTQSPISRLHPNG